MATDVYRAPEMRHRVGERHFSIWDGVPGSCHPPAPREGQGPGLRDGGCPAPCPLSPSLAEGSRAVSCREKFGCVRGPVAARVRQPRCEGGTGGVAQAGTGSAWPWAREPRGWAFAVSHVTATSSVSPERTEG